MGAASDLEIHDVWLLATHLIRHGSAQIVSNARHAREGASLTRKQVFESAQKIVHSNRAVTNYDVLQKKIYKSFKQEPLNRFFQTLLLAMGISDYRNNDFRVSFGRVTPARCYAKDIAGSFELMPWRSTFLQNTICFRCGKIASGGNTGLLQRDAGSRCKCDLQKSKQPGRSRAV